MPTLRIGVDSRDAVRGYRDFERAQDRATQGTREFDDRLTRTEGSFKKLSASTVALRATIAGLATGALAVGAKRLFELGSAAEETGSKFNTVFGASAGSVNAFLEDFANVAGLTVTQGQALAATAGSIVQGLGFVGTESAATSEEVLRLAGDLASFNNRDIQESFEALRGAITGEREALKSFGIVITETDVQQRALADGLADTSSELTAQDKALASLALITERAGVAVGDLERTQNSSANTARRVAARFRELEQAVATALLPVFDALLGSLDRSTGGFDEVARQIRGMATEVAVAAIEVQKLDNFVRVITLDRSFAEGRETAEELNREIQRLRAVATGVYDEARANEDVLALAFGLSDADAGDLANDWNALGQDIQRSTRDTVDATVDEFERLRDEVDSVVKDMNREIERDFQRQAEAMTAATIGGTEAVQAAFVGLDRELDQTTLPAIEATTLDSFAAIAERTSREVGGLTSDVVELFNDLGLDLPGPLGDIASLLERDLIGTFGDIIARADEFAPAFLNAFESVATALPGIIDTIAGFVKDLGSSFFFESGGTTLGFGGSGPTGPGFGAGPGVNISGGGIETEAIIFGLQDVVRAIEAQDNILITSNQLLFGIATNTASLRETGAPAGAASVGAALAVQNPGNPGVLNGRQPFGDFGLIDPLGDIEPAPRPGVVGPNRPTQTSVTSIQEQTAVNLLFIGRQQLQTQREILAEIRSRGGGLTASQQIGQAFHRANRLNGNPVRAA